MIGKYFEFHKGGESKEVFSSSFKNYEKKYGKKVDFVPVYKSTAKASCSKVSVQSNRQSQSRSKNKGVLNAATKYKASLILMLYICINLYISRRKYQHFLHTPLLLHTYNSY